MASYLDAKAAGGEWLVRIEDIDPPRELAGASRSILRSLDAHGLHWDGEVQYQSSRAQAYDNALKFLSDSGRLFACSCTRSVLGPGGNCGRRCTPGEGEATSLRFETDGNADFHDVFLGWQDAEKRAQDYVLKRKDGLYAYALAVVVDDLSEGITHVVRGKDLLHQTFAQIELIQTLGGKTPSYAHLPLIRDSGGNKLSKQAGASGVNDHHPIQNLRFVLEALRQPASAAPTGSIAELLEQAIHDWPANLPTTIDDTFGTPSIYPDSDQT